jgi:PleD family two-component response regulator
LPTRKVKKTAGFDDHPADARPLVGPAPAGREGIPHFLIAEDNVVNRLLLVRQLEKSGHAVTAVSDGKKAVDISSERIFDVILMDVHMP